tara:strand:+ start:219 stop:947 length:729 start_codon:yes stop_codon:yes gene_type:complete
MARSGFKMKYSPAKGRLGDFFSNLGKQLKSNKKDIGGDLKEKYSSKAQRDNRVPRSGESEYQFKVRTRKAKSKKAKTTPKTPDPKSEIKVEGGNTIPWEYKMTPEPKVKSKSKVKPKSKSKNNDGPRVDKVKKKEINAKTIKQDTKPTSGPLDPKYMPKTGDKELTFEDFQRITKGGDKKVVYAEYPGKPIIDWSRKIGKDITRRVLSGAAYLDELGGQPEIRSGIRKKSPSKKRGYKMKRK